MQGLVVAPEDTKISCFCESFVCNGTFSYRTTGDTPITQSGIPPLVYPVSRTPICLKLPTFVLDFFHCFHGLLCVSVHRFRRLPACIFSLTSDFLQIPPHDGHPCLRLTLSTAEGVVVFHHLVVAHAGRTRVTTNALRWTVCSGYNVPAPAICCVPVLPLRRRLPRGGISRSPPYDCHGSHGF